MHTILLVEDHEALRELYQETLLEAGYQVRVAANGHEALAQLIQHGVDLVVLDINMPGMDGMEVLERIMEDRPSLPVVINSCA